MLEVVLGQNIRFALATNADDLRNANVNKVLQELVQSMICVASVITLALTRILTPV